MATDFTPAKFQEYFEKVTEANTKALEAQTKYYEGLVKRSGSVIAELADARVSSLQDLSGAKTFTDALETNSSFEEALRTKLTALYEENTKALEDLQAELKELYSLDNDLLAQVQRVSEEVVASAKKAAEDAVAAAQEAAEAFMPKK